MDILGRIDTKLATSIADAEAANKVSGMQRAFARTWRAFVNTPEYVAEEPTATVMDIEEVRIRHESEVVTEAETGLETQPVPVDAKGEVVDMAQRRRLKEAREKRDAAYIDAPESEAAAAENLFDQQ